MDRTYLITGGAGFIGSHLVDRLIESANIICIDNFENFYAPSIKRDNVKEHLKHPNYKLYEADIRNYDEIRKITGSHKITHIVHLAAKAGVRPSLMNPLEYTFSNINGTMNLLECAREFGINKFVFGSSSSVYGSRKDGPFHEEMRVNKPISPYAATKASGEQICHTYSHLYGIKMVCLRFFTVYGPRQRPDLAIHKFSKLISEGKPIPVFGDGSTKRDYTYIDDIVAGIISSLSKPYIYEIINLGGGETISLNKFISIIEKLVGNKAKITFLFKQPGDVNITFANIKKARKMLGFKPKYNIKEGMKKYIEWYLEHD